MIEVNEVLRKEVVVSVIDEAHLVSCLPIGSLFVLIELD